MREDGLTTRWLLAAGCALVLACVPARADELHLRDGRVVQAEDSWEVGESIWYRQGKLIASFPKAEVVRITKSAPADAPKPAPVPVAKSMPGEAGKFAEVETRQVMRIYLKGGLTIDADAIWEAQDRVGYRLGKMQTFVDRADVERIARNVEILEEKAAQTPRTLRYSTGHRGLDQLIVYNADRYGVDPTLIYLVMQAESGFNHRAVSRVGARGLMQLMPTTASYIARSSKYKKQEGMQKLMDPETNLDLGQKYLEDLLGDKNVRNDLLSLLVAYNAGPGNLARWKKSWPHVQDPLLFIELIPSSETRAYVERVLANYWIYRLREGLPTPSLDAVAAGKIAQYAAYDPAESKSYKLAQAQ